MTDEVLENDNLILICGKSASGKSASLRNLPDPENVIYLNCESNKKLPFPNKFRKFSVTDPYQIYSAFTKAEELPEVHTIIVDSLTYLMDMFESVHVLTAENTMKAWGNYAQFFKNLMQQYVAKSTKNVIFTAHVLDVLNTDENILETLIKVKGALMNNGVESYFSSIIMAEKVNIKQLEGYENDLLIIDEEEQRDKFKYIFQTRLTEKTVHSRIRNPMKMWSVNETYINNDIQAVINRLHAYYK